MVILASTIQVYKIIYKMNCSVIASLSPLPDTLPETHFQLRNLLDKVAHGIEQRLLRAVYRGCLHPEHEFVLQGVRHFEAREENLGVPQKLAARGREEEVRVEALER